MSNRNKAALLGGSSSFDAVTPHPVSARSRALAALEGNPTAAAPAPSAPLKNEVSVEQLAHNPFNPRESLTDIREMADSLENRGIVQVLTVVTRAAFIAAHPGHDDKIGTADYVVLDGNRRLAGARLAGLDRVPVHVDDSLAATADDMLESALVAAVQHVEIEPLDQARALERLVAVHHSQREVAKRLGKSHVWVSQRLALLNLTPELQQAVETRELPVEIARSAGRLPKTEQQAAVAKVFQERSAKRLRDASGGNAVSTTEGPGALAVTGEQAGNGASMGATPHVGERSAADSGNAVSTAALGGPARPGAPNRGNAVTTTAQDQPAVPPQRPNAAGPQESREVLRQLGATPTEWAASLLSMCTREELDELVDVLTSS